MIETGAVTEGKIIRIMPFGVFVGFGDNQTGLVHISEISKEFVSNISDVVKIGDRVRVKVIGIDEKGRINLSIRQAAETPVYKKEKKREVSEKKPVRPADGDLFARNDEELSFEEKLLRFKQDSDEKMQTLKRNAESKRSGGYSRKGSR